MYFMHLILHRKESSSRDARKMYGDVTPGDTTHQDVILLYQNYFKNAFRNLPKDLKTESKEEKYELWRKAVDIFMASFEQNQITIIEMMTSAIEENSLLYPPLAACKETDEKKRT
uniref:Uncharacterized protein n=1 Tax=Amphimedon queenslandica TaxID=400682 RepID=A0A1X7TSG9_AMPQE